MRLGEMDPAWVARLLERYPRRELKRHLRVAGAAERRAVPSGRAQWLTRYAAFPMLVAMAPFDE